MEICAHLLVALPDTQLGHWLDGSPFGELHLELGCGKGRFLVESAKDEPEKLYVALEKTTNVLVIALERAAQEGLENIRFINGLADNLTDYFATGEVTRIYINFCDPWPANRHSKRRLTGRLFLERYRRVLRQGGEIHFKTDNPRLFDFSLLEFEHCGFSLLELTKDLHANGPAGVMTDYELKYHAQGLPIYSCVVRG
jgi:tRNA (guanine-N7-)-methyltransferase